MSRVLLSGFRLRLGDSNFDPPPSGSPYRLHFFDSSTSQPKEVYAGPEVGDTSLGAIVDLDAQGYVPVSGIWLDMGRYNIALEQRSAVDPINGDTWNQLWIINKVAGGVSEGTVNDSVIRFVDTVSNIRALTGNDLGGVTFNLGYYTLNDGGQGEWRWVADSLEVDDGGAYLKPTTQSTSVPGRWHRIMPSGGEVDVRMWGAVSGQADVSGNIELAQQWCGRTSNDTGITLAFPACTYNIASASLTLAATGLTEDAVPRVVNYHVCQNALFLGVAGVAQIHFDSPTIIDSTSPIISLGVSMYFGPGSVDKVNERWWNTEGIRARLQAADSHGLPVYLNEIADLTQAYTYVNKIIIGPIGGIGAYANITLKGGVEVQGSPRIALGVGSNGSYTICQTELNAWWFGYGSLSGDDQSDALSVALSVAAQSKSTLVIDSIPTPKGIYGTCGVAGTEVQARINGTINIYSGANLYLGAVLADRKHIFNILGSSGAPVTIENGSIYPEWFGAQTYTNSNTAFHYMMQCRYRGVNKESTIWIDGGGNAYTLTESIYLTAGGIGFKDMTLGITTESSNSAAIYMGDESTDTSHYFIKNVTINHTANGERRPTIYMKNANDVHIKDCFVNCNHGIALETISCDRMDISGNTFVLSNGAMFYLNPTLSGYSANINLHDNIITGLNNKVYGSATIQLLPANWSKIKGNTFVGSDESVVNIHLARDTTLETSDTGNVFIHGNMFANCKLTVLTKGNVSIIDNQLSEIIVKVISNGEVCGSLLRITNNNALVSLDNTNGYMDTTPSTFKVCIAGNLPTSVCTHKQQVSQATIAADDNGRVGVYHLFPYAHILSFQMSMLATNSGLSQANTYSYAPVAAVGIHQDQRPQADVKGIFKVATTGAGWSGSGRDWVQWSINVGTSEYYIDN